MSMISAKPSSLILFQLATTSILGCRGSESFASHDSCFDDHR